MECKFAYTTVVVAVGERGIICAGAKWRSRDALLGF